MNPRIDYTRVAPGALRAVFGLESYVRSSSIGHGLLHLIKLRASQINGCANCVDMHTKDARAAGEEEQRLHAIPVWRETPFFSDRERAALAWTEVVTELGPGGIDDAAFDAARQHFSEEELVDLTFGVIAINAWNRLSIAFRPPVGSYQPKQVARVAE